MRRRLLLLLAAGVLVSCEPGLRESSDLPGPSQPPNLSSQLTAPPNPCIACPLAPTVFTRKDGQSVPELREFAGDPKADYLLVVQDDGLIATGAEIRINGELVIAKTALQGFGVAEISKSVLLKAWNRLTVLPLGKTGAKVTVWLLSGAKTITPAGGTIVAPSGLGSLTVPAGALNVAAVLRMVQDTTTIVSDPADFALTSQPVALYPEGQQFSLPVTISLLPGASLDKSLATSIYNYDASADFMLRLPTVPANGGGIFTAQTTHFSTYLLAQYKALRAAGQQGVAYSVWSDFTGATLLGSTSLAELDADLFRALGQWESRVGAAGVTFQGVPGPSNAQLRVNVSSLVSPVNVVKFFLFNPNTYAVEGYFPGQKRSAIYLNGVRTWYSSEEALRQGFIQGTAVRGGEDTASVYRTLLHETGHSLGLDHYDCGTPGNPDYECLQPPIMAAFDGGFSPAPLDCKDLDTLSTLWGLQGIRTNCPASMSLHQIPPPAAPSGAPLPLGSRPAVIILDATQHPVPGVPVLFYVSKGTGSVIGDVTSTDAQGVATLGSWTIGAGANEVVASLSQPYTNLTFAVTGQGGGQSILAHYPLDTDGSDIGPNPVNGTITSNATFVAGRVGGGALHFTGGASYMEVPIAPGSKLALKTTDQFTTAMWIKPDQLGAPGGNALPLTAGINEFAWSTQLQSDGTPLINACTTASFCTSAVGIAGSVAVGQWHHVVQRYDGASSSMQIYVDGVLRDTKSFSLSAKTTDQFLYLGSPKHATQYGFVGSVDDVQIYSGLLSPAQILALANPPGGGSGPVALYQLNGDGNDASGNGNNGVVSGAFAVPGHTGVPGTALSFQNAGVVTVPSNPILKGLTSELTLVYWVNRGASSITSGMLPVARRVPSDIIHFISYSQPDGFAFQCCSSGGSSTGLFYTPSGTDLNTINDGAWHQIAVTRKFGAGGFTELYLDGVLAPASYTSGAATDAAPVIDAELLLGRQASFSAGQYTGYLDDVYIFDRILTQSEIQAIQ